MKLSFEIDNWLFTTNIIFVFLRSVMIWVVAYTIIFILIVRWILKYQKQNEPPGPSGMPFFGVTHQIDPRGLHYSVTKWAEEYGDVIKFKVSQFLCYILC